jgi:hypothetical protein
MNQVTGKARLIIPSVPQKKNNQRAQTVGVRVKIAAAAPPQPMIKSVMVDTRYVRKVEKGLVRIK